METVLAAFAAALKVSPFAAGALGCWLLILCWGLALVVVCYRSRRWERALVQDPPAHPYFSSQDEEP